MYFNRIIIIAVIFLLCSCGFAKYQKNHTILCKLVNIDTSAFYNYNYYEFSYYHKTYKVLSEKKTNTCENNSYVPLKTGEKYNLSLNEIWFLKINDTLDVDLSTVRMTSYDKKIFVGGNPNEITFLSSNICGQQILNSSSK